MEIIENIGFPKTKKNERIYLYFVCVCKNVSPGGGHISPLLLLCMISCLLGSQQESSGEPEKSRMFEASIESFRKR